MNLQHMTQAAPGQKNTIGRDKILGEKQNQIHSILP